VLKRSKNQDNQDKEEKKKMFNKGDKVSVLDEAING
jgi:hypothetical protein